MTWTKEAAAAEWGIDRRTLKKRMIEAGLDMSKKEYSTREITQAIVGDLKAEKIKGQRFDNELKEFELGEKRKELVAMSEVQKIISESHQPIRELLNAVPSTYASKCNPTDPTHAREALEEFLKTILPLIRAELPKPS